MSAKGGFTWTRVSITILVLGCGLRVPAYGFAGGTGEPNDPYQIATAADLLSIGSDDDLLEKYFVLTEDIDLDPNLPGGRIFDDALIAPDEAGDASSHQGNPFSGVFDGQGHTIRNLVISGRHGYDAGLFGKLAGVARDLRLEDVRVSGSPCGAVAGLNHLGIILRCSVTGQVSGPEDVGGIVGNVWDGALMDCRAEVRVTGGTYVGGLAGKSPGGTLMRCEARVEVRGDRYVGGLMGSLNTCYVIDSRADGMVVGTDNVGGLAGSIHGPGMLLRSRSACEVVAEQTAGGLAGDARFAQSQTIIDCYARGSVAGSIAGGLLGIAMPMNILNSYAACEMIPMVPKPGAAPAAVGGLFGDAGTLRSPLVVACFWDTEVAGVNLGAGLGGRHTGVGLSTEQMQQQAIFEQAGWDFAATWVMPEGGHPILQWELDQEPVPQTEEQQQAAED